MITNPVQPALETVIVPRTRDLGDGFEVRRALPSAQRRMVGPFVFFDQMGPVVQRRSNLDRLSTAGPRLLRFARNDGMFHQGRVGWLAVPN